ncbi:hypothetical protein [Enterobacter hormaechei]|uniref:hypothetical protein n=1 Tax=Enterobacter hormaechei TaxID=158836 RepID=UPI001F07DD32|nr:hypothetical protein [Enterobacter hormaechei]
MSNKHHDLLGVPKHANQHRLSRLTMEVHTDELRIMASAVESFTDELIAALEAAGKRISELEAREVKLPQRFDVQTYSCSEEPDGEWYARDDVLAALANAGVRASEEEGEHG